MRLRHLLFAVLALALPAQEADLLIARNLKVRGGAERLAGLKTLRMIGRAALIPDRKRIPWMEEDNVQHAWRSEMTVDGGYTEVDTFDGKQGWQLIPWAADKAPRPMPSESLRYLQDEERFFDLLLNYKARGLKAEYLGRIAINNSSSYKVRIPLNGSCNVDYYFDATTFQETQRDQIWREMGEEVKLQSSFDDFREIKGIVMPFFIERRAIGRGARERLVVELMDINPALAESRFGKPAR